MRTLRRVDGNLPIHHAECGRCSSYNISISIQGTIGSRAGTEWKRQYRSSTSPWIFERQAQMDGHKQRGTVAIDWLVQSWTPLEKVLKKRRISFPVDQVHPWAIPGNQPTPQNSQVRKSFCCKTVDSGAHSRAQECWIRLGPWSATSRNEDNRVNSMRKLVTASCHSIIRPNLAHIF